MSDDKYQKVLECIESLSFPEGTYLQLCNALKSIKDVEESPEELGNNIIINLRLTFTVHTDVYIYKFIKLLKIRGPEPDRYIYSVSVNNSSPSLYNKTIQLASRTLFRRLYHAKDIVLEYFDFDTDNILEYKCDFKNLGSLRSYYYTRELENCQACTSGDPEDVCDPSSHDDISDPYLLMCMMQVQNE